MAILSKGVDFSNGDQVTSTNLDNLVDAATFVSGASGTTDDSSLEVNSGGRLQAKDGGITSAKLAASAVTTAKLADSSSTTTGVTFGKIRYMKNLSVIGNVSGASAAPTEVDILDEDDLSSDSATALATQQSIKSYVDNGGGMTPGTYAGGESVTLSNGMTLKFGTVASTSGSDETVTFGTAFPTGIVNVQITPIQNDNTGINPPKAGAVTTSGFTLWNPAGVSLSFYWMAIGY